MGEIKELLRARFESAANGERLLFLSGDLEGAKDEMKHREIGREQRLPGRYIIGTPEWQHSVTCSVCVCVWLFFSVITAFFRQQSKCFSCLIFEVKPLLFHDFNSQFSPVIKGEDWFITH